MPKSLKDGFFADKDKIPQDAVIRTRKTGDVFTKFGGGTKKLNDYFTDLKIPARIRDGIPLVAKDGIVYIIFGIAVSELSRVDKDTKNIIQFTKKEI